MTTTPSPTPPLSRASSHESVGLDVGLVALNPVDPTPSGGGGRSFYVQEFLSVLKGAVGAMLDMGPTSTRAGDERSCVDILRRLLGQGGASELRINSLPVRTICVESNTVEGVGPVMYGQESCAICLSGYEEGDNQVRVLRCQHCYHAKCIDVWLRRRSVCPMCQTHAC